MKDVEMRGLVLQKYYDNRREGFFTPKIEDFNGLIPFEDIGRISGQLGEHGLVDWKAVKTFGAVETGMGRITAFGVDVVEGAAEPPINVEFVQSKTVNITGSSNVIVGDHNVQNITYHLEEIIRSIDSGHASPEQRVEAKNLLRKFIEHPLVTALAGAGVSGLLKILAG